MSRRSNTITIMTTVDDNSPEKRAADEALTERLVARIRAVLSEREFYDIEPFIMEGAS